MPKDKSSQCCLYPGLKVPGCCWHGVGCPAAAQGCFYCNTVDSLGNCRSGIPSKWAPRVGVPLTLHRLCYWVPARQELPGAGVICKPGPKLGFHPLPKGNAH